MPLSSSLIAIALYIVSSLLIAVIIRSQLAEEKGPNRKILLASWLGALLFHAISLYSLLVTPAGIDLGFFRTLSMVGFLASSLLLVSCFGRASISLGLIILPAAITSILLAIAIPEVSFIPSSSTPGLKWHIFVSLLAYSMLTLATLQALLLSYQNRHLHNHQPGGLIRILPSLQEMERLLFRFLIAGFVLLTIGLLSGFIFLENIFAQHLVHKTAFGILAWICYGILIWGHLQFGWRGKFAVRWTVGGFIFLMLAYWGSKFVLELVLTRA